MPSAASRDPSDSLCLKPSSSQRSFHHFETADGSANVRREIVDTLWDRAKTMVQAAGLVGDVEGRMRAAARGQLADNRDEFEPVKTQPELWELKWKFRRVGEFRLYHAEPAANPDMVALRFHEKQTEGLTADEIEAEQDREMEVAADRFRTGESRRWGHRPGCQHCLSD